MFSLQKDWDISANVGDGKGGLLLGGRDDQDPVGRQVGGDLLRLAALRQRVLSHELAGDVPEKFNRRRLGLGGV